MKRDSVQDPVCGMTLSRTDAHASTERKGRSYYFCSEVCRQTFDADPEAHTNRTEDFDRRMVRIPLLGLACAAGDRLPLERGLRSVRGVLDVYVNPVDESAYLTVDPQRFRVAEAVAAVERFGVRVAGGSRPT